MSRGRSGEPRSCHQAHQNVPVKKVTIKLLNVIVLDNAQNVTWSRLNPGLKYAQKFSKFVKINDWFLTANVFSVILSRLQTALKYLL